MEISIQQASEQNKDHYMHRIQLFLAPFLPFSLPPPPTLVIPRTLW